MGARNQFWCAGAAAGELKKSHFIGGRRRGYKILCRFVDERRQRLRVIGAINESQRAQLGLLVTKRIQPEIVGKQAMLTIGNQQSR